jgi:hypothetical protein
MGEQLGTTGGKRCDSVYESQASHVTNFSLNDINGKWMEVVG